MPTVYIFGIPRIASRERADLPLSAREAGLLAWLHLEGPSPRGRIAGLLWPAGDESQARANLRQALVRLKRSAGELLDESAGVMRLAADVVVPPAVADGSSPAATRLLGPLEFDDAPEFADWLQARRDAAGRERRREHLAVARQHLEAGVLDAALAAAEAVLAHDPAVEEAHRLRMEAFYLRGDRAAAITAWDDCRDALRTAYGITPSAATNELGRLVLAAEAAGQQQAAGLQARRGVAAAVLPAALRRPPLLVGRDGVLDEIARAFALGHGVVVAGPGGIGKSRLLAQAAAAMEPAILVGGRPGDEHLPGVVASRLVSAAIERFSPELDGVTRADIALLLPGGPARGQALQSALEHRRVLASVARTMLACHARGMRLVVVDDLQFADDLSMEAIAVVVGGWLAEPPDSAALPLFGCRPDELRPAAAALVRMMDSSARSARIDLATLPVSDIQALLVSLPLQADGATALDRQALARALHARVGGNPAFVLESVKALWLGGLAGWRPGQALAVPATLKESLRQRLSRLGHEALQLAQLAAVAQEDFSLSLAAAAMGRAPLALAPVFAELEAAQVLDGVRFSHDLVAEAARASLPSSLVAPLHQLVAEHLQQHEGAPSRIAMHLDAAGDARAAAHWHLLAGQRAQARWQLAEAAAGFDAALRALDPQRDRVQVVSAAVTAARVRLWQGRRDEAGQALDLAEPLTRHAAERVQVTSVRVAWLINHRRRDEAAALARRLADDLRAAGPELGSGEITAALRSVSVALPFADESALALELVQQLSPWVDTTQGTHAVDLSLLRGALLCRMDRLLQALPDLRQAWAGAARLAYRSAQITAGGELVRALGTQGHAAQALVVGESTLALAIDHGFGAGFEADTRSLLAMLLAALGRPADALAMREAALRQLAAAGRELPDILLSAHATVSVMCGRLDEAEALLARHPPPPPHFDVAGQFCARAHARLARARGQDALPWHVRAADSGASGLAQALLRAACEAPPTRAQAQAWLDDALARGLAGQARLALGQLARAALAEGDRAAAAEHARAMLAAHEAIDAWLDDTPARWLDAAALLQASGHAAEAAAARDAGRAWLRRAAATLPDAAAQRLFTQGHALHRELMEG